MIDKHLFFGLDCKIKLLLKADYRTILEKIQNFKKLKHMNNLRVA